MTIIDDFMKLQEILYNEYVEISVDFRVKTEVKTRCKRPDIRILDKRTNKMTPSEIGITSQDSFQIVQTQKLRKYDLLAKGLGIFYKLCGDNSLYGGPETLKESIISVILVAEMYKQPRSALKQVDKEEDNVKA
ncbi:hypothetical protein CWI36_0823p0010 [Hamiltosporidium magnivora]|uniref:Uncharacterized protein n=1 Tax=Hamiltosporidium magnivora TaxID=148818 RepID=A0A4Q9L8U3_9MICR|nr:hypothetical protein CWI36_0823p0010 [Hamiltosporidium magnivora]